MNTLVNVARYHMVDRVQYVLLPWAIVAFSFLVNMVVATMVATSGGVHRTGGLLALYIFLLVMGVLSVTRSLPFGFALGLSRRSYYLGTILLVLGLGAAYSLVVVAGQAVERATGGWGVSMHFFQVAWIFDGPWYLSWLTSFVVVVLAFVYGMWFGLVHRRWNVVGLLAFIATQVLLLLGAALLVTWRDAWLAVGEFFTTLTAVGLTGVLGLAAAVLALGGFTTMRRVTV